MQDRYPDEPDPVKRLLYDVAEALGPAVGTPDPACRAIYLADLARLVAAAQAANDALLHPDRQQRGAADR